QTQKRNSRSAAYSLLLLALSFDIEIPLFAAGLHGAFALQLVPSDRELVVDLELQVHHLRLLLIRPAHGAGNLVAVLLDRHRGRPLLSADVVLALPRADRV